MPHGCKIRDSNVTVFKSEAHSFYPLLCLKESRYRAEWKSVGPREQGTFLPSSLSPSASPSPLLLPFLLLLVIF